MLSEYDLIECRKQVDRLIELILEDPSYIGEEHWVTEKISPDCSDLYYTEDFKKDIELLRTIIYKLLEEYRKLKEATQK